MIPTEPMKISHLSFKTPGKYFQTQKLPQKQQSAIFRKYPDKEGLLMRTTNPKPNRISANCYPSFRILLSPVSMPSQER